MNEEEKLVRIYAKAWNRLDPKILEPYLADDVVYDSQMVLDSLVGKEVVYEFIKGKMQTIKKNRHVSDVFAEVGYCSNQNGYNVIAFSAWENRPCVVLAQGHSENLVGIALLDTEDGKIKRIGLCIVPPPWSATRTGEYPE
jgi:SnoaL-like polyketide cyclase.